MTDSPSVVRYSDATIPLKPVRAPDKVLVIGATGHVGRVFLQQGLELFDQTEFRVLLRDMDRANDFPGRVVCRPGDVRDRESILAACDGFGPDSLIFDSVTQIVLSARDDDGRIAAVNVGGVQNVIDVARELGATLHKAHSSGGIPCPKEGTITERTEAGHSEEEAIYASLPYLRAKKEATKRLLRAREAGLRVMVSYLPSPIGPRSRSDALLNGLIERYAKTGTYHHPEGVSLAYVDARDAAKAHWVAFMNGVHDDFILSNNTSHADFVESFERATGIALRSKSLRFKTVLRLGKALDFLRKWVFRGLEFPLSETTAYLMFANMDYSSAKAERVLGFRPRDPRDTFADHLSDLIDRGLIRSQRKPTSPPLW